MNGPHHLAKFDFTHDNCFTSEEVYRRCPFGNRQPPYLLLDMFLDIQWDNDMMKGLSVNRSRYATPADALWSPISEDWQKKRCEYQEKKGLVYKSNADLYPATDNKTGVTFSLNHSPIACNISHCDIIVSNIPSSIDKTKKRDIKAFLSTLFSEFKEEIKDASKVVGT